MLTKRARTWIAVVSVIVAIAIVLSVWGIVMVRRSFPQTDGTINLPGLDAQVEVLRDTMGVPHIYATTEHDLFMAQGFVHAQDRFWQMDFWRHIGSGRLSEMFGSAQLETDMFLRTMGWERVATQEWELATDADRAILEAYAEGVNAYLAIRQGSALSLEYAVLGLLTPDYVPEAWTPIHTLTWAKVMAWDLGSNMSAELMIARLVKTLGTERMGEIIPSYPPDAPQIIPAEDQLPVLTQDFAFELPVLGMDLSSLEARVTALDDLLGEGNEGIGSNNWVISGDRTTSGSPILANDPHLGIQMPAIWHEIGLHCYPVDEICRFDVAGFSFAGAPGVIIGHNAQIAWGLTNVNPDVQDLYIEKINPDNPLQYEVNGEWVDMTVIEDEILVAGEDPVPITIRYTRHGPILSDVDDDMAALNETTDLEIPEHFAVSLKWTALEPTHVMSAIIRMNLADDFRSFRDALQDFAVPSQNFVYADTEGNIGYQMPGWVPIRSDSFGLVPVPGWVDDYEWTGYIPFDELPFSYNPSSGYIVTANNAVVGPEYPYMITTIWDYGFRARRIVVMLEAQETFSLQDMITIQGDNHHPMGPILVPILNQLSFNDPELTEMAEFLADWDYQADMDSAQAALFNAFWRNLVVSTFMDELDASDTPEGSRAFLIIGQLLGEPENLWWDDIQTTAVETRDEMLRTAFSAAVTEIQDTLGSRSANWRWGDIHGATFRNETLGECGIAPIEAIFNRGPFPTSGGASIVNATGWYESRDYEVRTVPSLRMIVDLADLGNSLGITTTGESGHAYHPHYIDMADLWRMIQYHAMPWTREQVEMLTEDLLILTP
jgi:penicillin amidase